MKNAVRIIAVAGFLFLSFICAKGTTYSSEHGIAVHRQERAVIFAPPRQAEQEVRVDPEVMREIKRDISAPMVQLARPPRASEYVVTRRPMFVPVSQLANATELDPVVQTFAPESLAATTLGLNILGLGNGFSGPQGTYASGAVPPDPNLAVGTTQVVQWVNSSYAVFDKHTGTVLQGPVAGNSLWSGFGGQCESRNDGDPIVQYDKAAHRWIMAQPTYQVQPYTYCVAVSTTDDATGTFYRYAFSMPEIKYPKLGVWPDAYYFTANKTGLFATGAHVCAFDRNAMLNGQAATQQCFDTPSDFFVLPADLDGPTPPPAGSPAYLMRTYVVANGSGDTAALRLWEFHVDFSNPSNSTLTGPVRVNGVAAMNPVCAGWVCVPQSGTSQKLATFGNSLMYRLAYRNFNDHESIVASHTTDTGTGTTAIRWYEVRSPGTNPTVYQQGTYAPDSNFRWDPSIAMDRLGDIAVGYSVSSNSMYPAIRYAGRLSTDLLNTLRAENSIYEGGASQSFPSRWGDYFSMAIDPADDCTFWFTAEYLAPATGYWSTRLASFKFQACVDSLPDFKVAVSPGSQTVTQDSTTTYNVSITPVNGFTGTVHLSASGFGSGASGSFNPSSISGGSGSSTLTVTTTGTAQTGAFTVTITGAGGGLTHSTNVTLNVNAAAPTWTRVEETNSAILYSGDWYNNTYANNSGGSAKLALAGSATFNFSGTGARWIGYSDPWSGIANVYVDGVLKTSVDTYSAATKYQVVQYAITGLGSGNHNLKIQATDQRNAAASGAWVWVDAFEFTSSGAGGSPDFTIAASPSSATVPQGNSTSYMVSISAVNGFTGTVSLNSSGFGSGATGSFNPASVMGSGSSTLTVTTTGTAQTGAITVAITGTSGALTHSATVTLNVNAASITPTWTRVEETNSAIQYSGDWYNNSYANNSGGSAKLTLGGSATFSFSGTGARWIGYSDPWSGMANLYVDGVLNASVDTYSAETKYQAVQFTVTGLASGNHTLKIQATGQHNSSASSSWVWVDAFEFAAGGGGGSPDFTIAASPNSATVGQGGSTTYHVSVAPVNGFSGTVSLSVSGFGSGVTGSFNPASITGSGSSTLTMTATSTAQTGTFPLTITGASGALTHTAAVTLNVNASGTITWTRVEETNSAIQYSGDWYNNSYANNSGSSAKLTLAGSATFSFSGTGVRWIGYSDPWSGIANVYIDGVLKATIDTYSAAPKYQVVQYAITGLASGNHMITIQATGQRNPSASSAWIWVDAFEYGN